jgi:excisionase family DNA binding protein
MSDIRCIFSLKSYFGVFVVNSEIGNAPAFYTVKEAAQILRVAPATLYRSIRQGDFPALRLRTRYVIPSDALRRLAAAVVESGHLVDPTDMPMNLWPNRRIEQGGTR